MTNAVIFTCAKHIEAAKIAATVASRSFNVHLAIDKYDNVEAVGYNVIKTDFERNGNLNGFACAKGVASVMLSLATNGFVAKIDSDTIVKDVTGFDGFDIAGFVMPKHPPCLLGCFYVISSRALEHASACCSQALKNGVKVFPEDRIITGYAQTLSVGNFKSNIHSVKKLGVWHPTDAPTMKCKVANFGTYRIKDNWVHEKSLAAMRKFANS